MSRTARECHERFMRAVREGRDGIYEGAREIVESVRRKSGNEAAERAKRELWNYIKSDKKA